MQKNMRSMIIATVFACFLAPSPVRADREVGNGGDHRALEYVELSLNARAAFKQRSDSLSIYDLAKLNGRILNISEDAALDLVLRKNTDISGAIYKIMSAAHRLAVFFTAEPAENAVMIYPELTIATIPAAMWDSLKRHEKAALALEINFRAGYMYSQLHELTKGQERLSFSPNAFTEQEVSMIKQPELTGNFKDEQIAAWFGEENWLKSIPDMQQDRFTEIDFGSAVDHTRINCPSKYFSKYDSSDTDIRELIELGCEAYCRLSANETRKAVDLSPLDPLWGVYGDSNADRSMRQIFTPWLILGLLQNADIRMSDQPVPLYLNESSFVMNPSSVYDYSNSRVFSETVKALLGKPVYFDAINGWNPDNKMQRILIVDRTKWRQMTRIEKFKILLHEILSMHFYEENLYLSTVYATMNLESLPASGCSYSMADNIPTAEEINITDGDPVKQ